MMESISAVSLETMFNQRNETGDVTFVVQLREIHAHRKVLAALSPKYRAQFFGSFGHQDRIAVKNVSYDVFECFVSLFYGKPIAKMNKKSIPELFFLANESLSEEIVTLCSEFIMKYSDLIYVRELASVYSNEELKLHFDDSVIPDFDNLFENDEFLNCDNETLCYILDLELRSAEINIFNVCIKWATEYCKRNSMDVNNAHNLRYVLGRAVSKIRFCTMTTKNIIAIESKYPNFFSKNEIIQIIDIIENERIQVATPLRTKDWHPISSILDVRYKDNVQEYLVDWRPSWQRKLNAEAIICNYIPKRGPLSESHIALENDSDANGLNGIFPYFNSI